MPENRYLLPSSSDVGVTPDLRFRFTQTRLPDRPSKKDWSYVVLAATSINHLASVERACLNYIKSLNHLYFDPQPGIGRTYIYSEVVKLVSSQILQISRGSRNQKFQTFWLTQVSRFLFKNYLLSKHNIARNCYIFVLKLSYFCFILISTKRFKRNNHFRSHDS